MTFEVFQKLFEDKAVRAGYSADSIARCLSYAQPLIERNLPVIYNTSNLAALVGYNKTYLKKAVSYTKHFYRFFLITKANGKQRRLSEPLPSLKEIQCWILENILYEIPISKFAKAYVRDRRLIDNVKYHKKRDIVVCLDIRDFFTNIRRSSVELIFRNLGYSSNISNLLSKLCCLDECLPQGAPTSPCLSNIYMVRFDAAIADFCHDRSIRFTRYADDLTFSGNFDPDTIINFVKELLAKGGLALNDEKTKIMAKGSRQIVTGLVVNEKIRVPKFKLDKIRQEVYYLRKFGLAEHLKATKNDRANYIPHLMGKINFVLSINPRDQEMEKYLIFLKGLV